MTPTSPSSQHSTVSDDSMAGRALLWAIAAFFLAIAIRANSGEYSIEALLCLSVAIVAAVWGVLAPTSSTARTALNMVMGAVATVFGALWLLPDDFSPRFVAFGACLLLAAVIAGVLMRLLRFPHFKKWLLPAFWFFRPWWV
jgi:hypothetical protein